VNAPNLLSLARIALTVPLVWALAAGRHGPATAFLGVALATDFFDGWLARRYSASTHLGRVLDPLADKVLVGAVLISLVVVGRVPAELAIVVVARDFALLAFGWIRVRAGAPVPSADLPGKVAFTVLGIFLAWHVAGREWPAWTPGLVGTVYVAAGLHYAVRIPGLFPWRALRGER
jgi:CDP-diacylglycerol--glycerol-3-phosphate 3-phosphatidyltransferase